MKKNIIVATLVAAAMASVSAVSAAADGTINFSGSVTTEACAVTNNVGSPLTVTLGKVAQSAFTGVNSTAAATQFNLELTGCPTAVIANGASVKFDGTSVSGNNNVLSLTSGGATGVGIQLTDAQNKIVPLNTASSTYALKAGTNELAFVARYIQTDASVGAGDANATANFTIVYN